MAGPIRIAVLANASQARRELDSVASSTSSLGSKIGGAARTAGVAAVAGLAVAGAAAVKFGVDSVRAASDAQQSLGATETVFGKFADTVISTSDAAATKYGLSANVYRENANLLGSLFKNQGVALDQLGGKTEGMISTAADLAATFGGTTTEAVEALGAAFKGEYDMLERYGISIKQSDVNARLAAQGQDKLTGAALKAAEQQAKSALIAEQAAQTNGAFAKETDTLAHQQQVLGAQFENLKAKLGTTLLPIVTSVVRFVSEQALPAFERWGTIIGSKVGPVIDAIRTALADLAVKLAPIGAWFAANPELIKGAAIALGIAAVAAAALGVALGVIAVATSPITLIVVAIAAVGAGFLYAYKHSETFRNGVQGIITAFQGFVAAVIPIIQQVAGAIATKWAQIAPQARQVWTSVQNIVQSALSIVRSVIQRVTSTIQAIWKTFGGTILRFITTTMTNIATVIRGAFKVIEGIFKVVSSALKGDWQGVWNGIKQIVSGALSIIKGIVQQGLNVLRTAFSAGFTALKAIASRAWDAVKNAVVSGIAATIAVIRGLPGKILSALGNLGSLLYNAGKSIIQGLINGIESMIGSVKSKLSELTSLIPKVKGPPAKDKVLLRPAGRLIMKGLIDGFKDGEEGVKKSLGKLTELIEKTLKRRFKDDDKAAAAIKTRLAALRDEYAQMTKLGALQDKNTDKIEKARDRYRELVDQAKQYAATVKDSVVSFGSIVGLGVDPETEAVTINGILGGLGEKLNEAARFRQAIESLRGRLNDTALQQLIDAGVESGLATAEALAAGTESQIAQINAMTASIANIGGRLGNSLTQHFNAAGVRAGAAVVRGLEREGRRLDAVADRLANRLLQSVFRGLQQGQRDAQRAQAVGDRMAATRTVAPRAAAQNAPGRPVEQKSKRATADLIDRLLWESTKTNKLLTELINVEIESPTKFGREINRAASNGMRAARR